MILFREEQRRRRGVILQMDRLISYCLRIERKRCRIPVECGFNGVGIDVIPKEKTETEDANHPCRCDSQLFKGKTSAPEQAFGPARFLPVENRKTFLSGKNDQDSAEQKLRQEI